MAQHKVFVYGTLKSGFANHHYLSKSKGKGKGKGKSKCLGLGPYLTQECYPLYLEGERYSPWLIDQAGTGHQIEGEMYALDEATLSDLDALERAHLPQGYLRKSIELSGLGSATQVSAFAYFMRESALDKAWLRTPMLRAYLPEHADLYVARAAKPEPE